jgi:menaquinone-dependent protoporphyrinogen oxidase
MSASILVGYATRSGSAQEVTETIAATIAATLREGRLTIVCQPLKEVQTLEGCGAVVLGAPLYMFRWHKDAMRFLSRHRQALMARPAAVFALGPFHEDPKEFQDARAQLDKELLKSPWFAPIAIEIFGGKFDPTKLRFPMNLIPALKQMPASDVRDWAAIRSWAYGLAGQVQAK